MRFTAFSAFVLVTCCGCVPNESIPPAETTAPSSTPTALESSPVPTVVQTSIATPTASPIPTKPPPHIDCVEERRKCKDACDVKYPEKKMERLNELCKDECKRQKEKCESQHP